MDDDLLVKQFVGCRELARIVVAEKLDIGCCLIWHPGDAPSVRPSKVDQADSWEICHDGVSAYDLWYIGTRTPMSIVASSLSLREAALRFVQYN
jgi:hypothetical protein